MSALDWIERLVQRSSVKNLIASHRSILNTLLEPCFNRFVEFSEWQGRTVSWWKHPINRVETAPIRARALAILERLIDEDSWLVALEAIRAIERALHRVAPSEASRVGDAVKSGRTGDPNASRRWRCLSGASSVIPRLWSGSQSGSYCCAI